MRKPKIYLAGTFSEKKYRRDVKIKYGESFNLIDPFEIVDQKSSPENLVSTDLKLIDKCDIIVAYIRTKTIGTSMEIMHAFNSGKQIYVICPIQELKNDPWLLFHSTRMFDSIESCFDKIWNNYRLFKNEKEQNINDRNELLNEYLKDQRDGVSRKRIFDPEFGCEIYEMIFGPINKNEHKCDGRMKKFHNLFEVEEMENIVFKGEKRMDKKNMNMGEKANKGMCMDDSKNATRLLQKNFSPLVVRKFQILSWPMFIGVICDANLDDLDDVVLNSVDKCKDLGFLNGTIQGSRNACGFISEEISNHYNAIKRNCMEGSLVFWYVDKCAIASATGDLMSHEKCCMEFYQIVNILTKI